ncbi:MAG: hypothetical protein L0322_12435 [Chloroflexi bacterium]|nr:hypothetical protein [Chloroflexota bacterium]
MSTVNVRTVEKRGGFGQGLPLAGCYGGPGQTAGDPGCCGEPTATGDGGCCGEAAGGGCCG